jgi:hypothetical protein
MDEAARTSGVSAVFTRTYSRPHPSLTYSNAFSIDSSLVRSTWTASTVVYCLDFRIGFNLDFISELGDGNHIFLETECP